MDLTAVDELRVGLSPHGTAVHRGISIRVVIQIHIDDTLVDDHGVLTGSHRIEAKGIDIVVLVTALQHLLVLFVEILEMQVDDALVHQCGVGCEHHVAWRVGVLGQGHKTAEHVVLQLASTVEMRTGIVFIKEQVLVRRIGDTQMLLVDGIDAFVNEYGLFRCCHINVVLWFYLLILQFYNSSIFSLHRTDGTAAKACGWKATHSVRTHEEHHAFRLIFFIERL